MPTAPAQHCSTPGCPSLQPCARHTPAARRKLYDDSRGSRHERGYDRAWERFVQAYRAGADLDQQAPDWAEQLINRNHCTACRARGIRISKGLEYDHIIPLSQGGARLDPANVQPLCHACHVAKTSRERAG